MLINADAARMPIADKTIHAVITSPPYYGLREYDCEGILGVFPNLGLENTPEEYILATVEIFKEVKRVLRDDGVAWLNLGDCYVHGVRGDGGQQRGLKSGISFSKGDKFTPFNPDMGVPKGNLLLLPHRIAIALREDGWIIRNDLIWYKRNPTPEPRRGWEFNGNKLKKSSWRHTRAHEYIFQLVKKMQYWKT